MEYRPCPSYPSYSAISCGSVRRDNRAGGKPLAQRLGPTSINPSVRVAVAGKYRGVLVRKLVADAWPPVQPETKPSHFVGWTLVGEYRVVPSAPAYEVTLAGRIRCIETMREPIIRDDRGRDRVYTCGREVTLQTLINEAWPECAREIVRTRRKYLGGGEYAPLPSYPDGRIVTVQQYRRDLELARYHA
jgi:hypothetical protein